MKSALIIFPGSNCDRELQIALETVGMQVERVWHKETNLPEGVDIVFLPGGFSLGDYLRPGAIAASSRILRSVVSFADKGGYIVGICNGFQVLLEAKLLPGALLRNKSQKFLCQDEKLIVSEIESIFTKAFELEEIVSFPIAHNDGNYYCTDADLDILTQNGQILFRYQVNPNGSKASVAAVCSENKRILGIMPHPERVIRSETGGKDGLKFFESIINFI